MKVLGIPVVIDERMARTKCDFVICANEQEASARFERAQKHFIAATSDFIAAMRKAEQAVYNALVLTPCPPPRPAGAHDAEQHTEPNVRTSRRG